MSFTYDKIKYKIVKGDQGFGIALGGGASKRNEFGETGIVITDVVPGPAFGNLVVGDIILKINGIDMTKSEKPHATSLLKGSNEATLLIRRRVAINGAMPGQQGPPSTIMDGQMNPTMMQQMQQAMQQQQIQAQQLQQQQLQQQMQAMMMSQPMNMIASAYEQSTRNDPNAQMAAIMTSNQPTKTYISDDDNYIAPRQRSDYSRSSSREKHRKPKKSSRRKDYSSSERSSSRGSSLERDLNKIKIRDDYVTIPVKAHEPKKVVLRKKQNESFGMKLGTRVFVQGLTSNGLAMNEGLNNEDLILSINGNSTDSMTIPEVLSQLVNVDTVELEVQQVTGGTVTLPADVLNGLGESSRDSKADSKRSKNKKHKKKNRRSASEEDHYRRTDRYNNRYDDRYDDRYNSSRHRDRSRDYNDPYVSQKSTHV